MHTQCRKLAASARGADVPYRRALLAILAACSELRSFSRRGTGDPSHARRFADWRGRRGTLDLLVLEALSWEPMHGFGLSKWIEERTHDELEIADSAHYKSLYRLEDAGAISVE